MLKKKKTRESFSSAVGENNFECQLMTVCSTGLDCGTTKNRPLRQVVRLVVVGGGSSEQRRLQRNDQPCNK